MGVATLEATYTWTVHPDIVDEYRSVTNDGAMVMPGAEEKEVRVIVEDEGEG